MRPIMHVVLRGVALEIFLVCQFDGPHTISSTDKLPPGTEMKYIIFTTVNLVSNPHLRSSSITVSSSRSRPSFPAYG